MRSAKSFPIVDVLIALTTWVARWATRKSNLRQQAKTAVQFSHADGNASTVISSHPELLCEIGDLATFRETCCVCSAWLHIANQRVVRSKHRILNPRHRGQVEAERDFPLGSCGLENGDGPPVLQGTGFKSTKE
jgi:hypothetical protein